MDIGLLSIVVSLAVVLAVVLGGFAARLLMRVADAADGSEHRP